MDVSKGTMEMGYYRYTLGARCCAGLLAVLPALCGPWPAPAMAARTAFTTSIRAHAEQTAAHRIQISAFRASTVAAVDAWVAQPGFDPLPVRRTTFAAGTTQIGFIFLFKGAVPHVTAEQIVAYGPVGLRVTSGRPRVLQRSSDGIYEYLSAPAPLAYPNGHYTAAVLIDGRQAAKITFTVG